MDYTKQSFIGDNQRSSVIELANLISSHVLSAFPHMPKDIFDYARYEIHTKGSYKGISVHFNYFRRVQPINIKLSDDESGSTITAENLISYLNMPTKKILGIIKELSSKGFWSNTLNSSVNFVGLRFDSKITYLSNYFQKEEPLPNGKVEYHNFIEEFK